MRGLASRFKSVNSAPMRARDPEREAAGKTISFPPPIAGLKLLAGPTQIPDGGAFVLDNWTCLSSGVFPRGGYRPRNTGIPGTVAAIMPYESGALRKLFAVGGASTHGIYAVSLDGDAAGSALVSSLVSTIWSSLQFTTGGGSFLIATGAGNAPRIFDGATWASVSFTGGTLPTLTTLGHAWAHGARLFFAEHGSMNAWYLDVDSIGGALTKFSLGGVFPLGGSLLCGATWTTDAGNSGLQSSCVFMTTMGEVAIYDGHDPTSWTLRGVYHLSPPLGQNCFLKTGGDVAVMTRDGLVALSQAESLDRAALANESVSKDIRPLWRAAVAATDGTKWQITRFDALGVGIISVPEYEGGQAAQFVINLETGAWSRWIGYQATCFAVTGDELVFGVSDGTIMRAGDTGSDNGAPYSAPYIGPYRDKGGRIIAAKLARAVTHAVQNFAPKIGVLFDYSDKPIAGGSSGISSGEALWNSALWNSSSVWGGGFEPRLFWQSCSGIGTAFAPCVVYTVGQVSPPQINLLRTDLVIEVGAVVA